MSADSLIVCLKTLTGVLDTEPGCLASKYLSMLMLGEPEPACSMLAACNIRKSSADTQILHPLLFKSAARHVGLGCPQQFMLNFLAAVVPLGLWDACLY